MSNYNDIIKNAHNLGILLDGCGKDERYYTFGSYIDLCGASPKELMPKCCCCDNDSGDTGLIDNLITINVLYDNTWKIEIYSEKPVSSNILITILYEYIISDEITDSKEETFTIKAGSSNNVFELNISENTKKVNVKTLDISPNSDSDYNYIIVYNPEYKIFYGVVKVDQTSNIDENIIKTFNSLSCKDTNDISFEIPAIGIKGIDDMEDENEVNEILKENAYDLVIAYDTNIENYEIIDLFGEDDNKFLYTKSIKIDNIEYSILIRHDPDTQRNVYDTNTGPVPFAPINYSFNIK